MSSNMKIQTKRCKYFFRLLVQKLLHSWVVFKICHKGEVKMKQQLLTMHCHFFFSLSDTRNKILTGSSYVNATGRKMMGASIITHVFHTLNNCFQTGTGEPIYSSGRSEFAAILLYNEVGRNSPNYLTSWLDS